MASSITDNLNKKVPNRTILLFVIYMVLFFAAILLMEKFLQPWMDNRMIDYGIDAIIALAVICMLVFENRKNRLNWRWIFSLGIIYLLLSFFLVESRLLLLILGIAGIVLGLTNKDKWKSKAKSGNRSEPEKAKF